VKIVVVVILMTGLVSDYRRFRMLYLVIALAAAFWAIKGGLKTIVLGPHQVYGKSYDNNLFALTSVMSLPLLFYFALSLREARWKAAMLMMAGMGCLGIVGSRSRAGFLALLVVLALMGWSSRYRLGAMLGVILLGGAAFCVAGGEIRDRISSIASFRDDKSASSRFFTWQVAMRMLASRPLTGVGFGNFEVAKDELVGGRKAAHNIYLQNLAELGIAGHCLWLCVVGGSMVSTYRFMRRSRRLAPHMQWAYYWSRGLLLGMLGFCVHGLFHNEEYLELMFALIGLSVSLQAITRSAECALDGPLRAACRGGLIEGERVRRRAFHPGRLAGAY